MGEQTDNELFMFSRSFKHSCDDPSELALKQPRVFEALGNTNLRTTLSVNRWKLSVPYKSELCYLFQRGKCYYGENCHFSHSVGDFDKPEDEKGNVKECKWFANGKFCPYGDKCQYIHGIDSHKLELLGERDVIMLSSGSLSNDINNNDGIERRSLSSGEGRTRPGFHKTRLCRIWMKYQKCSYGEKCIYAHGENELKVRAWPRYGNASYQKHRVLQSRNAPSFSVARKSMSGYAAPFYNVVNNIAHKKNLELQGKSSLIKMHINKITGIYGDWIDEDVE